MLLVLLIVLLVLGFGGFAARDRIGYGYAPSGLIGLLVVILLVLVILGYR